MKTAEYLDALRAHLRLPSDYAAAKVLGVTVSSASGYRNGKHTFDDATALRVAELLEIDPQRVVADMHAERAKDDRVRAFWQQVAATAAAVVLGVAIGATPPTARASTGAGSGSADAPGLCIMSNRKRRRRISPGDALRAMADALIGPARPLIA